jgi:hypothetical protein
MTITTILMGLLMLTMAATVMTALPLLCSALSATWLVFFLSSLSVEFVIHIILRLQRLAKTVPKWRLCTRNRIWHSLMALLARFFAAYHSGMYCKPAQNVFNHLNHVLQVELKNKSGKLCILSNVECPDKKKVNGTHELEEVANSQTTQLTFRFPSDGHKFTSLFLVFCISSIHLA